MGPSPTRVASFLMTKPRLTRPIKVIKTPKPTDMEITKEGGIFKPKCSTFSFGIDVHD